MLLACCTLLRGVGEHWHQPWMLLPAGRCRQLLCCRTAASCVQIRINSQVRHYRTDEGAEGCMRCVRHCPSLGLGIGKQNDTMRTRVFMLGLLSVHHTCDVSVGTDGASEVCVVQPDADHGEISRGRWYDVYGFACWFHL